MKYGFLLVHVMKNSKKDGYLKLKYSLIKRFIFLNLNSLTVFKIITMFKIQNVAIVSLILCILLIAFSGSHPTSATGGYTSAPGDGVCSQCHTDNNTSLDGDYTITGIPADIEANTTYTVDIQLTNPSGNASRGGFQILALDEANTQGGTWSNESAGSSLKTSSGKTYLGHQGSQSFPGSNELNWSADWTSPDEDDVTFSFYAVSILANGGNGSQNDRFLLEQFDATIPDVATPMTLTIDLVTDASCSNSNDGSATVIINGGVAPFDILWNNGETTETATMLPLGNALVVVTDDTGFSAEIEIEIGFILELEISVDNLDNASCFGTPDGSISVSVPNGTEPIDYDWSNGQTGNTINNIFSGTYSVTATDANGCDANLDILVTEPDEFDIIQTIETLSCNGDQDGFIILNVFGGTSPYSFLWEDGSQNDSRFNLGAGTYVTTISDFNGCSVEVSTDLTEPAVLDLSNVTLEHPVCNGDSNGFITVSPMGGTSGYEYSWSNGETTQTISGLNEGEYMLTVTDSEGCIITNTYTLTDQFELVISTSSTAESSPGAADGSATVDVISGGSAPYLYEWSTGDLTATANNLTSGSYNVTVMDANGCSAEGIALISSGDCALSAEVDTLPVTCNGMANGSAMITVDNATEPISYIWSDGSTLGDRSDLGADTYSLIVLDAAGCSDTVMNIIITEPEALSIQINVIASNACGEEDNGELEAIVTGGTLTYNFLWSNGDNTPIVDNLANNDYSLVVTDSNGCSTSAEASISSIDNIPPSLILQDLVVYADSSGFIDISASSFDNGSTDNCSDVTLVFVENPMIGCEFLGTQIISIIGSDTLNNSDTMDVMITLIDTLPPMLIEGQLDNVELDGCEPFIFDFPVFMDNCSDSVVVEQLAGFSSGQIFPIGITEQIYSISDMSGNQTMYSFTVNVTSDLSVEIITTGANCFDEASGSISIEITGIHNPYVQDSSIINTGLFAGDYLVSILDTVGCQILEIVNISEPSELNAQINTTPATTNNSSDGEIVITVNGGTESYTIRLFDSNGTEVGVNDTGVFSGLLSCTYCALVVDENGCDVTIDFIEVTFVTSTVDLFETYSILTYPNPVTDQLTVSIKYLSSNLEFSISTITGQTIWSDKGNTNYLEIDLTDYTSGLYMLSVTDQKSKTTRKISIQH